MKQPKIALVHDYLVQYGGAEKTLEAISELFPDAPIYSGNYKPDGLSKYLNSKKIVTPKNGLFAKFPKYLTFLMPFVFENFDLREFDIIISDGTAWPKSVLTNPDQLHISYIHTPPRFLYGYSVETAKRNTWYFKPFVSVIDHFLRIWDFSAAQRPDILVANSKEIKRRIKKFYGRGAVVIYPPVDAQYPVASASGISGKKYFIGLGRLSAYKNFDVLIKAFDLLERKLIIIGTGKEEATLKKLAGKNVEFKGRVSEKEKHTLLENAVGLINPVADEDLGIVPIEAMSHGTPVLVHKSGGHLETVKDGVTGMFFEELVPEKLAKKIKGFEKAIEKNTFSVDEAKKTAQAFSKERFQKEFKDFVTDAWKKHNAGTT